MNEAIGNALLFKLALVFIIILTTLFIGSLAYTKAYKVKNKIVEEIEKNGEDSGRQYTTLANAKEAYNKEVAKEIELWLKNGNDNKGIGYRKNPGGPACITDYDKGVLVSDQYNHNYQYCVYRIDTCDSTSRDRCGVYYHVITYMYVDFPLIDEFPIAIHGETRTFYVQRN